MKCLLITGLGRSGSTLSHQILNANKNVFVSDESSHFIQAAHLYKNRNARILMGMNDEKYANHLCNYLLSAYSNVTSGEVYFGDKSPATFVYLDSVKTILTAQNIELNLIWTVRHPFDQAVSWLERFKNNSLQELSVYQLPMTQKNNDLVGMFEYFFHVWIFQQKCMLKNAGITIVYEEIVAGPDKVMRSCHDDLGLDYANDQIDSAFKAKVIGGDPKFMKTTEVHQNSTNRYLLAGADIRDALARAAVSCNLIQWTEKYNYRLL